MQICNQTQPQEPIKPIKDIKEQSGNKTWIIRSLRIFSPRSNRELQHFSQFYSTLYHYAIKNYRYIRSGIANKGEMYELTQLHNAVMLQTLSVDWVMRALISARIRIKIIKKKKSELYQILMVTNHNKF